MRAPNSATLAEIERTAGEALRRHLPAAIGLRHAIHADPRIGGDERATAELVKAHLELPSVDITEGMFVTVGDSGPTIAVRAELDALPIQEENVVSWRSRNDGAAHLCGHDVHAAALAAVTLALRDTRVTARFISVFQPREEVMPSGAPDFCSDPRFRALGIDAMVGVHLQPMLPEGKASVQSGPINASADDFEITIVGRPAHGGYPHLGADPIVAAAAIVQSVQHVVSRRVDPLVPAVITMGKIAGGSAVNQVAQNVSIYGTVRSLEEAHREQLLQWLENVVAHVAAAHSCQATVAVRRGEPVLRNDAELAAVIGARLEANGLNGGGSFRSCGADDFAYYSEACRSLMIFAGVGGAEDAGLHHPRFLPDDSTVELVSRIMLHSYFAVVGHRKKENPDSANLFQN